MIACIFCWSLNGTSRSPSKISSISAMEFGPSTGWDQLTWSSQG